MTITFKPLNESHFPLLLRWLEAPYVKKWWDQGVTYTMELVKEKFSKHIHGIPLSKNSNHKTYAYIICLDKEMIGYIQAYNAHDFAQENHLDLNAISGSVCGVDLFIGESYFLNKGLGTRILNEFENQILSPHFDWCVIDPAKDNLTAIKAFTKARFKIFEQFQTESTTWMIKELSSYVSFSYDPDPDFDRQISNALRRKCEDLTSIKQDFESISIYLNDDEKKIGGSLCYIHGQILWCDSIYILEPFQNKGFGKKLIEKLLNIASKRNLSQVQLNTYFPKAYKFFTKCGFEEVAIIPNWKYDLTCYLMRRII